MAAPPRFDAVPGVGRKNGFGRLSRESYFAEFGVGGWPEGNEPEPITGPK